jgi:hypothetical protein
VIEHAFHPAGKSKAEYEYEYRFAEHEYEWKTLHPEVGRLDASFS